VGYVSGNKEYFTPRICRFLRSVEVACVVAAKHDRGGCISKSKAIKLAIESGAVKTDTEAEQILIELIGERLISVTNGGFWMLASASRRLKNNWCDLEEQ
jgi:EAL domain-containing protein (putative c-di-GMP-specific phosphodiesterase class I)